MSLLSTHDYRRRRAERVRHLLRQLWGDDLPPGPEPELTVLIDAVAGDDHLGAQDGYVVQSDRLSYDALALLLRRCSTPSVSARALPRELLTRVFDATHRVADDVPPLALHPGGQPSTSRGPEGGEIGTWHLDADRQVLSWDDACAAVLGRVEAPRSSGVLEELEEWTCPQDRAAVAAGFDRCVVDAQPHRARFRVLHPRGGWITCTASGQRVVDVEGRAHVVGVLQRDTVPSRHP